ncbi:hypothetical protein RUM43_010147 [Polyplax serrata]|uniref:Uncharacterized protein n=1 Tax=Polyplax serrata TaxID=468196 RepID=A0AAN8PK74_POLSC
MAATGIVTGLATFLQCPELSWPYLFVNLLSFKLFERPVDLQIRQLVPEDFTREERFGHLRTPHEHLHYASALNYIGKM